MKISIIFTLLILTALLVINNADIIDNYADREVSSD